MKVLITQPKGKEHLVEAFKAAGAELISPIGSYTKPDLIIPTVDEELPTLAYLKPFFAVHGTRVMVSDEYAVNMTRDKAEFYRFCRRHNFKTPNTMQGNMVLKPRFGKASKGVQLIDRSHIIQEYIDAPEVSIDYFADFHGNCLSIIPRYRKNVVKGESQDYEIVKGFNFDEVKRLGIELNLIGHNVIQGFLVDNRFVFSEVNCRFGGGSHLTFSHFNSPEWLINNL